MLKRLLILVFISCFLAVINVAVFVKADTNKRLQQVVINKGIVLNTAQRINIITNCKNAQTLLGYIQQRTDSQVEERINIYTTIQQELQAIKFRMRRQGADASETDLLTGKIQQGLGDFNNLVSEYKLALLDVVSVDCTTQPEYFQAGLIVVREKRAALLGVLEQLQVIVCNKEPFEQLKNRLVI